ncbi:MULTISPECIES: AAA family ATPase [unclassified Helicobacter]|uniref:AAA family ATPase n=1 Tax=unclassified Helicobacter TaxID=2593540 RepID=UPI000AED35FF|nr:MULTISPECIES: AAA family ATPase [unclassified Helicobacter]
MSKDYSKQIIKLKKILGKGLVEKDEVVAMVLLCMIAGKSIFLYGPPGTAKSLVARRVSCAFKSNKFFDYLMNRFSTPEEVFGPLKISELRKDNLVRNIEDFLPDADFAFLDEIWKSSPAILNSLLTIINEKKFRNGKENINVPLRGLIATSNELPQKGASLEALYDRFIMRLIVPRIEKKESFEALLDTSALDEKVKVPEDLLFDNDDLNKIKQKAKEVKISEAAKGAIMALRYLIQAHNDKIQEQKAPNNNALESDATSQIPIDVSERRWIAIMDLLRVVAVLSGRDSVVLGDLLLLEHCLWSDETQKDSIKKILQDALKNGGPKIAYDRQEYDSLKKEISRAPYHDKNTYETDKIDGKEYIKYSIHINGGYYKQDLYIPIDTLSLASNQNAFVYIDEFQQTDGIQYKIDTTNDKCSIYVKEWAERDGLNSRYRNTQNYQNLISCGKHPLPIKNKKGNIKPTEKSIKDMYMQKCKDLQKDLEQELQKIKQEQMDFYNKNANPFIEQEKFGVLIEGLQAAKDECEQLRLDIKRLHDEIEDHPINQ